MLGVLRLFILWSWGTESWRMSEGEEGRMRKEERKYKTEMRRHLLCLISDFLLKEDKIYNTGK